MYFQIKFGHSGVIELPIEAINNMELDPMELARLITEHAKARYIGDQVEPEIVIASKSALEDVEVE